jgi:hypothetical protein
MTLQRSLPVIKVIKPVPTIAATTTSQPPRQPGENKSRNTKLNKENSNGGGKKGSQQSK